MANNSIVLAAKSWLSQLDNQGAAVKAASGFNFGGGLGVTGYANGNGYGYGSLPIRMVSGAEFNDIYTGTEELNYDQLLGNVWESSLMSVILNWYWRTFSEAPCTVQRRNPDDHWQNDHTHPLAVLLNRPHEFFTPSQFWEMILLGRILDGNAYVLKNRDTRTGQVVELIPIPHWQMEPAWENGDYISYYRYTPDATKPDKFEKFAPEDIIHFKNGVDPRNTRKGMAPWRAQLRLLVTDKEADLYESVILHNKGVPSVIIMPADGGLNYIDKDDAEKIKTTYVARTTGRERGKPVVFSDPYKIQEVGLSPANMMVDKLRQIPETRLAAAYGVPAAILGLLTGIESSTLANVKTWWEYSYQSGIMPLQRSMAETLTHYLLIEFEADSALMRVAFDVSEVYSLQGQRNDLRAAVAALFRAGLISRGQGQVMLGIKPDSATGDKYIEELMPQQMGLGPGHSDTVSGAASGTEARNGTNGGDGVPTSAKGADWDLIREFALSRNGG